MVQITLDIKELSDSEKHKPQGHYGVQLTSGECLSWRCPMIKDSGSTRYKQAGWLLAQYAYGLSGGSEEEGPDEFIFTAGGHTFYVEVNYIHKQGSYFLRGSES